MCKANWIRFNPTEFVFETNEMSPAAVGGYTRLVCHQLQRGELPADDAALDRICGGLGRAFPEVRSKLVERDGRLVIPWVDEERQRASSAMAAAVERASAGGRARWRQKQAASDAPTRPKTPSKQCPKDASSNTPSMLGGMQNQSQSKSQSQSAYNHPPPISPNCADSAADPLEPAAAGGSDAPSEPDQDAARRILALYPPSKDPHARLDLAAVAAAIIREAVTPHGATVDEIAEATRQYARTSPRSPLWARTWFSQGDYRPFVEAARIRAAQPAPEAVIGRVDPQAARRAGDAELKAKIDQDRMDIDRVLGSLSDDELAAAHRDLVASTQNEFKRKMLADADPRRSPILRDALARYLTDRTREAVSA